MTDNTINMNEGEKERQAIASAKNIVTGNLVVSILISLVALFVVIVCIVAFFGMQNDSNSFANLYYNLTDRSPDELSLLSSQVVFDQANYYGRIAYFIMAAVVLWAFVLSVVSLFCVACTYGAIKRGAGTLELRRYTIVGIVCSSLNLSAVQIVLFSVTLAKLSAANVVSSYAETNDTLALDARPIQISTATTTAATSSTTATGTSAPINLEDPEVLRKCLTAYIIGPPQSNPMPEEKREKFVRKMNGQIDFSFCAFLLSPIYWGYRKCYAGATLLVLGYCVALLINVIIGFRVISYLPALISALLFYKCYRAKAVKTMVSGVESGFTTLDTLIPYMRLKGGTSIGGAILFAVITVACIAIYFAIAFTIVVYV